MQQRDLERLEGGRLKGGILRSHIRWIRDHRSPSEERQLWASLPPDIGTSLSGAVLVGEWYPFAWLVALDRAIAKQFGQGDPAFLRELGRYSARINVSTTYRAFDRKAAHDFFANSALLHRQFQDFGSARYERTGETSGRMIHEAYPCFSPVFCESAIGYYEECILTHGGQTPTVVETECQCAGGRTCSFQMQWA